MNFREISGTEIELDAVFDEQELGVCDLQRVELTGGVFGGDDEAWGEVCEDNLGAVSG